MFAGPATYNVIRFNTGGNSINRHSIHRDPLNGLAGIVAPVLAGAWDNGKYRSENLLC